MCVLTAPPSAATFLCKSCASPVQVRCCKKRLPQSKKLHLETQIRFIPCNCVEPLKFFILEVNHGLHQRTRRKHLSCANYDWNGWAWKTDSKIPYLSSVKSEATKNKAKKRLSAFVEAFENEYRNADNSHYESPSPQPDSAFVPEVLPPALVQPMPGIIQSNDIPTFGEFCVEYKRVKQKMLSPTSWELYEKILSKYYIPMLGNLPINEIRPLHVQRIIDFFSSPIGRTDGKGHLLAPPTIAGI